MINSITLVGDIIYNGSNGLFAYSFSFFRSSPSFGGFFLLLFLSSGSSRSRRCHRSRCGCWSGFLRILRHRSRLGHRSRRRSFILRDFTVGYIINLIGENHAVVRIILCFIIRMLVIICKRHSIVGIVVIFFVFFVVLFVKFFGIYGENHVNRLFCRSFLCGFFCNGLVSRSFLCGLFCNRLAYRSFLCGIFCNRLVNRSFLCGFFCNRLVSRSFLCGIFCNRLVNRSFLCRPFCNRLVSKSFFLSLLLRQALFNLIKEICSLFSSSLCLFLFPSDLFFDRFSDSSFSIFLFFGESSFLFFLLTSLSRSHRTFFFVLFELLSVIFGVSKGCFSFLLHAG